MSIAPLNLFYDPAYVIKLIGRLLVPGGKLVCQTVLATTPRDKKVIAEGARNRKRRPGGPESQELRALAA